MKPYLLHNDAVQHEERLILEKWYAERHGRKAHYSDILHELQRQMVRKIRSPVPDGVSPADPA